MIQVFENEEQRLKTELAAEFDRAERWKAVALERQTTIELLTEKVWAGLEGLRAVVNSTVHPETAVRAVMVDLKPIRAAIKKLEEQPERNNPL